MATGINKSEQLSADALTATIPGRDPHPLPPVRSDIFLNYANKVAARDVMEPVATRFQRLDAMGAGQQTALEPNSLVLSDNLLALHAMTEARQKVTLFYLDPPYNTGHSFQSRQLEHSYNDDRDLAGYVEAMRRRLILMRELMTEDGSIYVHIGHRMLAHLKIVMDEVFGIENFRNLIARRKCSSKNFTKHQFLNLNDYVLFYTKSKSYKWKAPGEAADDDWILKEYPKTDARGRYKLVPVHAPGTRNGETGGLWRGKEPPPGKHWQYVPSRLDELDRAGELHWSRNGNPRRKVYLSANKIRPYTDYWHDFRDAHHQSIAITGYPTEKNLDMMRMIVGASTDPGDLVVDPYCGSGTTLHAAELMGRRWIGIDESFTAARASLTRIRHGVKAMGDYVERLEEDIADVAEPVVVDLFDTRAKKGKIKVAPAPLLTDFPAGTASFLVEEGLLDVLGQEVRDLASI